MNAIAQSSILQDHRNRLQARREHLARHPMDSFPFHRGMNYAQTLLAYTEFSMTGIPVECSARFAGVGNPLSIGNVYTGETVLDHACGSGLDLLMAAKRIGETGQAIGVDMTSAMRDCAGVAADLAGLRNVQVRSGVIESLPVEDGSVDLLISNGVINQSLNQPKVVEEMLRVLKPGGRVYLSAVVLQYPLTYELVEDVDYWIAGIGGAGTEEELIKLLGDNGLQNPAIVRRFNNFHNTVLGNKLPQDIFPHSVNVYACKPRS